jgi:unsaturated rhamnogalacturonyl hydrolase
MTSIELASPLAEKAALAAEHLIRYPWRVWWFADSVGFEGLLAATEVTGDERYRDFAYGMTQAWLSRTTTRSGAPGTLGRAAPEWDRFDFTAPGVAMVELALHYENDALLAKLEELAEWQMWRPQAGGVTLLDPQYALWVWVDCMQFQGPFLTRLAAVTGKEEYRRAGVRFLLSNHDVLTDETGLYSHTYDVTLREANQIHWGRGQGWAMRGLWQTWSHLPPGDPDRERIGAILAAQLDALVPLQQASGHWRTIVDDPDAYEETSVAAFYVSTAYPALRAGILDGERHEPAIERAWRGLETSIDENGRLRGVSGNTHAGDVAHYRSVPRDVVVPWGQGPALLAIRERLRFTADEDET